MHEDDLEKLFSAINKITKNQMKTIIGSVECSPKTVNSTKLSILKKYGVTRLSMGIQSWLESETRSLGRPQSPVIVEQAISKIKQFNFDVLNLDLIYGIRNQTSESFLYSIDRTLYYKPEEIFLYPLYIREQTGLGKKQIKYNDNRMELYRVGRDYLLKNGYQQISMRCFRKNNTELKESNYKATMHNTIGIGAGARSYTSNSNYSTPFAVKMASIRSILENYSCQTNKQLGFVNYGIVLSEKESKIRFILKSLIEGGQLNINDYKVKFATNPFDDFKLLKQFDTNNWILGNSGVWKLTSLGMEKEDTIGPAFYSSSVKQKMQVKIL